MFEYKHQDLYNPLLKALRQINRTASLRELEAEVAKILGLSKEELADIHKGNITKFQYRLGWVRTYLKKAGYIENVQRGEWRLTEKGKEVGELGPTEIAEMAHSKPTKGGQSGPTMLALSEESLIANAQKELQDFLKSKATKSQELELGFQGGSGSVLAHWFEEQDMWIGCSENGEQSRYWNALGFGMPFDNKDLSIVVEFNPQKSNFTGRSRAAFLTNEDSDAIYLAHSGGIGGGKKGVGKTAFLNSYSVPTVHVDGRTFINVGEIGSESFLSQMKEFGEAVQKFKASVSTERPRIDRIDSVQYWNIHAGSGNRLLDEYYEKNIITIPWGYLGDLTKYKSKDEIFAKIRDHQNSKEKPVNKALACENFVNKMKIGDHVFVKENNHTILAHGIIKSDYIHDASRTKEKNLRQVEWIAKGKWTLPKDRYIDRKKLTELTRYAEYVDYMLKLVAGVKIERTIAETIILLLNESKVPLSIKEIVRRVEERKLFHFVYPHPARVVADGLQRHLDTENLKIVKYFFKDKSGKYGLLEWLTVDSGPSVDEAPRKAPKYDREQLLNETLVRSETIDRWLRAIRRKRRAVFYGPPGTGKSYLVERLAKHLVQDSVGFIDIVQFHPSYTYEEFIQGIRPRSIDGQLDYPLVEGRFLSFCKKARERSAPCVMIIDEINRAELSRVFGELMYVLEDSNREVTLASGDQFSIPANVFILGTMNTADRSIAVVDHALRRRFAFIPLFPDYKVLRAFHQSRNTGAKLDGLITTLLKVNREIDDRRYEIGVSFFMDEQLADHLEDIWTMEIEPYLEEYFFDRPEVVENYRWHKIRTNVQS